MAANEELSHHINALSPRGGGPDEALPSAHNLDALPDLPVLVQRVNREDIHDASERQEADTKDDFDDLGANEAKGKEHVDQTEPAQCGVEQYGCEHYRRRAMIVAPCCDKAFWCRHCHNAACSEGEADPNKRHVLDRKAVREVVCAVCGLRQDKARSCARCHVAFGRYSCLVCSFFDDDISKKCFHCEDCGICRVGGRHNFFHCRKCNCCYAVSLQDSHICIENSMHANCPVCCEFLFDSIKPIGILPCGHTLHQECLRALADRSSYTCPVCMKSVIDQQQRGRLWEELDEAVQATRMPHEYASLRVAIMCNDCCARSFAPFHVLGHKCRECGSYNTRRT